MPPHRTLARLVLHTSYGGYLSLMTPEFCRRTRVTRQNALCTLSHCYTSLRYLVIYPIAFFGRLKEVFRWLLGNLTLFRPLPNGLEVSAGMLGVEIDERARVLATPSLHPDLSEHADIDSAHQLLAEDVEAVGCEDLVSICYGITGRKIIALTDVFSQDVWLVLERPFAFVVIVVEVEVQCLPE